MKFCDRELESASCPDVGEGQYAVSRSPFENLPFREVEGEACRMEVRILPGPCRSSARSVTPFSGGHS